MFRATIFSKRIPLRASTVWTAALAILVLMLAACGGGSTPTAATTPTSSTTATRVMLTDGPSDTIASFEITINSIVLNSSTGSQVTVMNKAQRMEISRLAEDMEPLSVLNVPGGTYTSATITVSNPEVTVIDPATKQMVELAVALNNATVNVNFTTPITMTGNATSLNFDLDLQNSVAINGGSATVTPVFLVTQTQIRAGEMEKEHDGAMDEFTGMITAISGTTFTAQNHAGMLLTFNTDANTQYEDIAGFSALKLGMLVEVKATSKADGSLLATAVQAKIVDSAEDEMELEGLITQTTGSPVTTFQLLTRLAIVTSGVPPAVGQGVTVNLTPNTVFRIPTRGFDFSNLPFTPTFDASHLIAGQSVEVDTQTPGTTPITASRVAIHNQTVKGVVSNLTSTGANSSTFTLTVASDSVFATLTGSTTVTVFKQPGTDLRDGITINNGDTVRVRGLLFLDGTTLKLVALRIGKM